MFVSLANGEVIVYQREAGKLRGEVEVFLATFVLQILTSSLPFSIVTLPVTTHII